MARKKDLTKKVEKIKSEIDELASIISQEGNDTEETVVTEKKKLRLADFDLNEINDIKLLLKIQTRIQSRITKLFKEEVK